MARRAQYFFEKRNLFVSSSFWNREDLDFYELRNGVSHTHVMYPISNSKECADFNAITTFLAPLIIHHSSTDFQNELEKFDF